MAAISGFAYYSTLKFKAALSTYKDEIAVSTVLVDVAEDTFQARVAAMDMQITGDLSQLDVVAQNRVEITDHPLLASLEGRGGAIGAYHDEMLAGLADYEASVLEYARLMQALDALVVQADGFGVAARQSLSEIRESAFADADVMAAYRSGVVQENLMLGRYRISRFARSMDAADLELAAEYLTAALEESDRLLLELQNPDRRNAAVAVYGLIGELELLLPQLQSTAADMVLLGEEALNQAGDVLSELTDTEVEAVVERQVALGLATADVLSWVQLILPTVIGSGVVVMGLFAALVLKVTARRFRRLVLTTEDLAKGNLAVEIKGAEHSHEIGRMAKALISFREAEEKRQEQISKEAERQAAVEQTVSDLSGQLKALAGGDLSVRIDHVALPEFEDLKNNFNASVAQLEGTIRGVLDQTQMILAGVQGLSSGADDLSRRTETQASSLAETSATIEQIGASVKEMADGAEKADSFVSETRASAEQGRDVVSRTVDAMRRIQEGSQKISQIIGVIDDIAFQTNLLALNAGVEAARAGSAGQGFAVVASEVRALAQRSGEAAREINQLIAESGIQVEEGAGLADQTSEALIQIAEKIITVSELVSKISIETNTQAQSLSEINGAVADLDGLTQSNAAMVEETTAATYDLKTVADELGGIAATFQLSQSDRSVDHGPDLALAS